MLQVPTMSRVHSWISTFIDLSKWYIDSQGTGQRLPKTNFKTLATTVSELRRFFRTKMLPTELLKSGW